MSKFEIFQGTDKQYYYRLKAPNGEIIGASEGYKQKKSAEVGISSVKQNAPFDTRYTMLQGADNRYYFNLKATNNEIILRSQGYQTKQGTETGKSAIKQHAPNAKVYDLT